MSGEEYDASTPPPRRTVGMTPPLRQFRGGRDIAPTNPVTINLPLLPGQHLYVARIRDGALTDLYVDGVRQP